MPWLLKLALLCLVVFAVGAGIIVWACMSTGWGALGRLAWGSLTAGVGVIGSALFSIISAVIHQRWRTFSLVLMSASVLLFLLLLLFAKFA